MEFYVNEKGLSRMNLNPSGSGVDSPGCVPTIVDSTPGLTRHDNSGLIISFHCPQNVAQIRRILALAFRQGPPNVLSVLSLFGSGRKKIMYKTRACHLPSASARLTS